MKEVREPSFLVFSDDWGEHPSSCQHLFKHIAKDHKVLWVNTVGMRAPALTVSDFKKAVRKIKKMILGEEASQKMVPGDLHLAVYQPPMVPFPKMPGSRDINRKVVVAGVRKRLAEMDIEQPLLITTVPNACDYIGCFGEKKAVYYCVDDFTEWPGLDQALVRKMEDDLIEKCDMFIATSNKLYERLQRTGKPTTLLPHGVDVEMFSHLPAQEHPLLADIPKPRVGYYGLFDERSDQGLLAAVAKRLPRISFVITGPVVTDTSCLRAIPNIYFTGPVPYKELPAILTGWEACFLAYAPSQLTDAISPLKLKEYLASGKPVIATSLPETRLLAAFLLVGETVEEWVSFLRQHEKEGRLSLGIEKARREYLANESWEKKAAILREFSMGREKAA